MRQISVQFLLLLPLLAAGTASAQESERFHLEKSADGYVRMDTMTGEMSICEEKWGELVCRLTADERTAVQDEIERLQSDIRSLEERIVDVAKLQERVSRLENSVAAKIEKTLPTEEDFNKTMSYVERFFRGVIGIVKDLERENADPATPQADKT